MNDAVIKKQSLDYEMIALCFHEASHSLIALLHFIMVEKISVIKENDDIGYSIWDSPDPQNLIDKKLLNYFINSEIMVYYAGLAGEKIYYHDICGSTKFPINLRIGSRNDLNLANKLISKYNIVSTGRERVEYKKKIQDEVSAILSDHWEEIKLIVHLLYKKKKIYFDDLQNLLTKKTTNKQFWREKFKKIRILYLDNGDILPEKDFKLLIFE